MRKLARTKLKGNIEVMEREAERMREPRPGKAALAGEQFQTAAFLAKSLSDENRLRILYFISNGKKSVSRIAEELSLSQPLVSHHMRELKRSLLVKVERSGPFIYYELADPRAIDVVRVLGAVATDLLASRKTF
jgi:DNA-binding transcriptional ArsR family regulator